MRILALDDSELNLKMLVSAIREASPADEVADFTAPLELLRFCGEYESDVAFLDIEMPGMNGLEVARRLKARNPQINIIFVTAYSEYTIDALSMHVSGYILKPVTAEAVERELRNLRFPVIRRQLGIRAHTFGNFDVFVDGDPIIFKRTKSKEILAYLIDRKGAGVSKRELASILWGEEEYTRSKQIQLQTLIAELASSLSAANAGAMLRRNHNNLSVDVTKFGCDYYEFEAGKIQAINAFHGEYMNNYGWAEVTAATLSGW